MEENFGFVNKLEGISNGMVSMQQLCIFFLRQLKIILVSHSFLD